MLAPLPYSTEIPLSAFQRFALWSAVSPELNDLSSIQSAESFRRSPWSVFQVLRFQLFPSTHQSNLRGFWIMRLKLTIQH